MAEIKSTMELVLEKTKNLSLSEDEKKTLRANEWTGKARGWVQKYLADAIGINELKSYLSTDEETIEQLREILKLELLNHIHLNSNGTNAKIFQIFRDVLDMNPESLVQKVRTMQKDMEQDSERQLNLLKGELQDKGISGSAVLPNLSKHKVWEARMEKVETDFHEAIRESAMRHDL